MTQNHSKFVTHAELKGELLDLKADEGMTHARMRSEWLEELSVRLDGFLAGVKAERWKDRLWTVGALALLKFDLPHQLTAGAFLAVAAYAAKSFLWARFTSN